MNDILKGARCSIRWRCGEEENNKSSDFSVRKIFNYQWATAGTLQLWSVLLINEYAVITILESVCPLGHWIVPNLWCFPDRKKSALKTLDARAGKSAALTHSETLLKWQKCVDLQLLHLLTEGVVRTIFLLIELTVLPTACLSVRPVCGRTGLHSSPLPCISSPAWLRASYTTRLVWLVGQH